MRVCAPASAPSLADACPLARPPSRPPGPQLVLLCVLPVVQFCTDAFSQYARNTDAEVIFGSQFKYIFGFRYFWQYNVFLFTILGFTLLAGVYFGLFPSDRTHLNKVMAKIKAEKSKELKAFERKLEQKGGALSLV